VIVIEAVVAFDIACCDAEVVLICRVVGGLALKGAVLIW
jgi:hypothetical protein